METVAIIVFGGLCFTLGFYASTQFSSWIESRIKPYTTDKENSDIKELSEKLDNFIKQLTGEK